MAIAVKVQILPLTRQLDAITKNGPAGNKPAHNAEDVWAFFKKIEGKNCCMICKWVSQWCHVLLAGQYWWGTDMHASNSENEHTTFKPGNSMTTLWLIYPNSILISGLSIVTSMAHQPNGKIQNQLLTLTVENMVKSQKVQNQQSTKNFPMRLLLMY